MSRKYPDRITLKHDTDEISCAEAQGNVLGEVEWKLYSHVDVTSSIEDGFHEGKAGKYSNLTFTFHVARKIGFYFWNFYFIMVWFFVYCIFVYLL